MKLILVFAISILIYGYFIYQYVPKGENYQDYAKSISRRITVFKRIATDCSSNESLLENQIINFENVMSNFCKAKNTTRNNNEQKIEKYIRKEDCILTGYATETIHKPKTNEVYGIVNNDILTILTGEALCEHNLLEAVYQETKRLSDSPMTLSIDYSSDQYSSCGQVRFKIKIKSDK